MRRIAFLLLIGFVVTHLFGQSSTPFSIDKNEDPSKRCGVTQALLNYKKTYPEEYQQRLAQYLNQVKDNREAPIKNKSIQGSCPDGITIIPIAFHIFHRTGEVIGQGINFSVEDLQAAVAQLNVDFAGHNNNKNKLLEEFQVVDGGHTCIQFTLAKINRINRSNCPQYISNAKFDLLHQCLPGGSGVGSANDPNDYLNVYVSEFTSGLLGQASCIPLLLGSCNDNEDGVLLDYRVLRPYALSPAFPTNNEGSVLTHEIGHWLGLPHVDGDIQGAGCAGDDGFVDTNPQSQKTRYDCSGIIPTSCNSFDNVFNFMDYADDCATAMFTLEQRAAMQNTLNGIRLSLKGSYTRNSISSSLYDLVENPTIAAYPIAHDTIDCFGAIDLQQYIADWYPSAFENRASAQGLQHFTWSSKGLNGAFVNNYFEIGDYDIVHNSTNAIDHITLTLSHRIWDPVSGSYDAGQIAGQLEIVTNTCDSIPNNICEGAIKVAPLFICQSQTFSLYGGDDEGLLPDLSCAPKTNKDVWIQTTMTPTGNISIALEGRDGLLPDLAMEVYSGTCDNLTFIECNDDANGLLQPQINILNSSIPAGEPLWIRIADNGSDEEGLFDICIEEIVPNDFCPDAITLDVNNNCVFQEYALKNATPSLPPGSCEYCSYLGSASDIWFEVTVPASGNLVLTTELSDVSAQRVRDVVLQIYRGSCDNLQILACNDDFETTHLDYMATLQLENQPPGEVLLVRLLSFMSREEGYFKMCAYDAPPYRCAINLVTSSSQSACDPLTDTYEQGYEIDYVLPGYDTGMIVRLNSPRDTIAIPELSAMVISNVEATGFLLDESFSIQTINTSCQQDYLARHVAQTPASCTDIVPPNDVCGSAITLPIKNYCEMDTFSAIGARDNPPPVSSFCYRGEDLWFNFTTSNAGSVRLYFQSDQYKNDLAINLFKNSCNNLLLENCYILDYDNDIALEFDNLLPNTTYTFRLIFLRSDYVGDYAVCLEQRICDDYFTVEQSMLHPSAVNIFGANHELFSGNIFDNGNYNQLIAPTVELTVGFEVEQGSELEVLNYPCIVPLVELNKN